MVISKDKILAYGAFALSAYFHIAWIIAFNLGDDQASRKKLFTEWAFFYPFIGTMLGGILILGLAIISFIYTNKLIKKGEPGFLRSLHYLILFINVVIIFLTIWQQL